MNHSKYMDQLVSDFEKVKNNQVSLEYARNKVRNLLYMDNDILFPMGAEYVYISELIGYILGNINHGVIKYSCNMCTYSRPALYINNHTTVVLRDYHDTGIIKLSEMLNVNADDSIVGDKCPNCYANNNVIIRTHATGELHSVPHLLAIEMYNERNRIKPDLELTINYGCARCKLRLCGIIYGGQQHFTSRYIDKSGTVWYHDGITTGKELIQEYTINLLSDTSQLRKAAEDRKQAILCIYKRI